ncbi:MAG: hypothetical protein ACKVI3_20325 [Verrucomicrobiia bacterium]
MVNHRAQDWRDNIARFNTPLLVMAQSPKRHFPLRLQRLDY